MVRGVSSVLVGIAAVLSLALIGCSSSGDGGADTTETATGTATAPTGTATAAPGDAVSATPTAALTVDLTPAATGWQVYESTSFGVRLAFPEGWSPVANEIDRFAGDGGFVILNAMGEVQEGPLASSAAPPSAPLSIEVAAEREASHKLMPYGSSPEIVPLKVDGYGARLILPSADQPAGMNGQAEMVVQPLQPVEALGHPYRFLLVYANEDLIREIASTIEFLPGRHVELRDAAAQTRLELAARLGALLEGIEVLRWEAVTWSDGCLGLGGASEACTEALVDGFSIWMVVDDGNDVIASQDAYLYRTDLRGRVLRFERGPVAASEALTAPTPAGALARE